ncbi:LysR family transcriptional regulator [Pseudomonas sp. BN102]|uniref:LysR family transcriptional regulator n=1 Tax=Pseudomonas sp. BN102 TaxID=2567886 RepID=UPI002457635F|nr:LysR family transcriptional regulator [Pseudomonas sp. BN102]MDH4607298.1 LysR family transcriptional regulator [Pseudomonas sp. BN102]
MQKMNDLRRIDLNLLVVLDALLAEQHVTRAAERLHLSQPAVSHALGRLRDLLGDPLLVRSGGGLVPTPRALELQRPLIETLARVQALLAPSGFDPAASRRKFRLAMSDYGAACLLPALSRALRREALGIDLEISQGSREAMLEQLQNGEIDLAAGVFPELPAPLRSTSLFEEDFACLLERASLPADGSLDLATYLARPHVLVEMSGGGAAEIERALTRIRERRRIAVRLPHWNVAPELIAGTDLILTVATRGLRKVEDRSLVIVPPPFVLPGFAFDLAWHQRGTGDPGLDWLRSQVQAAAT